MDPTQVADYYSTRFEEGMWGVILVAITLAMHGFGMVMTLSASTGLKERLGRHQSFVLGIGVIILASWMIIVVHMIEVSVWARFFLWKQAVAAPYNNISLCYYFALMDYTTLGSSYNLKPTWRLLEGMIAIAGLITFAWSTGVLLTLAQEFQDSQLAMIRERRSKGRKAKTEVNTTPGG
jgi:hypothetical protein